MLKMIAAFLLFITPLAKADTKPFDINMDRVKIAHGGSFGESKIFMIPTVYLRFTARTKTEISTGGSFGASAKAKILVEGLDKTMLQGLAQKVQDDLATKIKALGYQVLTYNDVKEDLKNIDKKKTNSKFGLPTDLLEGGVGTDFVIATPNDEQAFDFGFTGETFPYRAIAKKLKAVVIVPDIRYSITEVTGSKGVNAFGATAKLNILPLMRLDAVMVHALEPDASTGAIQIQTHGTRLAGDNVGSVTKVSEDNNEYAGWSRSVGDFSFNINPEALSEAALRVAYAVNDLTVKTIKDEQ